MPSRLLWMFLGCSWWPRHSHDAGSCLSLKQMVHAYTKHRICFWTWATVIVFWWVYYRFPSLSSISKKIETARTLLSIRLWFFLQAFFASFCNINLNFGCSSCRKLAMWLTHLASWPQRPPMIAMACYGMLWNAMGQERWRVLNCFRTVQCNRLRIIASGMPTHKFATIWSESWTAEPA